MKMTWHIFLTIHFMKTQTVFILRHSLTFLFNEYGTKKKENFQMGICYYQLAVSKSVNLISIITKSLMLI